MTWGPVLIQWLVAVGFFAYGSVLLASLPPASMYMNPTLPTVGGWWLIHACAHSIEFASRHIGSGPGVTGLSGMQVKPFVPLRSVRIVPSASIATSVAPFATLDGAAFIALAMSSASVGFAAAFFLAGEALVATTAKKISTLIKRYFARIEFLLTPFRGAHVGIVQCRS